MQKTLGPKRHAIQQNQADLVGRAIILQRWPRSRPCCLSLPSGCRRQLPRESVRSVRGNLTKRLFLFIGQIDLNSFHNTPLPYCIHHKYTPQGAIIKPLSTGRTARRGSICHAAHADGLANAGTNRRPVPPAQNGRTGSTRRMRPRWKPWSRPGACGACIPCQRPRTGWA